MTRSYYNSLLCFSACLFRNAERFFSLCWPSLIILFFFMCLPLCILLCHLLVLSDSDLVTDAHTSRVIYCTYPWRIVNFIVCISSISIGVIKTWQSNVEEKMYILAYNSRLLLLGKSQGGRNMKQQVMFMGKRRERKWTHTCLSERSYISLFTHFKARTEK